MTMTAETPTKPKNIYQKINDVMLALEPMRKEGKVSFGNTKYNYVTAERLFATLQDKLALAGVVIVPTMPHVAASPNEPGIILATLNFRVVNADDPTDYFEALWHAQAPAKDDKGASKAGTSGLKYFLMRLFLISDEEDPDSVAESPVDRQQTKPRTPLAVVPAPVDVEALRNEVLQRLEADPDAASKLPKVPAEMTEAELVKTHSWLARRQRASS